jgi:hypothetical protein
MKLPHYPSLPAINDKNTKKAPCTQNVLNLDNERQKESSKEEYSAEKGARDTVPEREDKLIPWNADQLDSMTLVKGFFQQWVSTPDNFRSLIQVIVKMFLQLFTLHDAYYVLQPNFVGTSV